MYMEQFKNKILFFADLDDSIFQTKRKDANGKYKATFPKNILKTSFYTKAQFELLNFILSTEEIIFIPLTARTEDQFKRTNTYIYIYICSDRTRNVSHLQIYLSIWE